MSKLHLVVNRRARHLREGCRSHAALIAAASGFTVHETHTLRALDEAAARIASAGADAVVLAGGDGTTMAGLTALTKAFAGSPPAIAIAPFGTVNTVARNWDFRGAREPYAARLLAAARAGRSSRVMRPTLRIEDDRGGERSGFIFGAGLVARFFEAYYDAPTQGTAAAARLVSRIFAGSLTGGSLSARVLAPARCKLTVDGATQPASAYSLVVASVLPNLGLGMRVTYRAGERAGAMHLVASALGPAALGPQLPLVLLGRRLLGHHHVDTLAAQFTLRFDHDDAYVLDGELLAAREVRVTAGPDVAVLRA
jgi:hypothetical protein